MRAKDKICIKKRIKVNKFKFYNLKNKQNDSDLST